MLRRVSGAADMDLTKRPCRDMPAAVVAGAARDQHSVSGGGTEDKLMFGVGEARWAPVCRSSASMRDMSMWISLPCSSTRTRRAATSVSSSDAMERPRDWTGGIMMEVLKPNKFLEVLFSGAF